MFISESIGDTRRWRQYRARTSELPQSYRAAFGAENTGDGRQNAR